MSDIVRYLVILPLIHTTVHLVYINTLVTHCDQQQLSNVSMFAGRDHCYTIQCVTCFNRHLEWFKYTPAASISFKHVSKPVKTKCFTISCIPPTEHLQILFLDAIAFYNLLCLSVHRQCKKICKFCLKLPYISHLQHNILHLPHLLHLPCLSHLPQHLPHLLHLQHLTFLMQPYHPQILASWT